MFLKHTIPQHAKKTLVAAGRKPVRGKETPAWRGGLKIFCEIHVCMCEASSRNYQFVFKTLV